MRPVIGLTTLFDDDKPLLGICRGIQFINAYLGGALYQDLQTEYNSKIEHHMMPPYDRAAHSVIVADNTILSDIIGPGIHEVNSYHHQAVKDLSPRVIQMASSSDGLVEAIAVRDHRFAIGVQWHPESLSDRYSEAQAIFNAFVEACEP